MVITQHIQFYRMTEKEKKRKKEYCLIRTDKRKHSKDNNLATLKW